MNNVSSAPAILSETLAHEENNEKFTEIVSNYTVDGKVGRQLVFCVLITIRYEEMKIKCIS